MSDDDNERRRANMAMAVKRAREEMPATLELIELRATIAFARFVALQKAGFSHFDALTLCTKEISL